MIATRRTAYLEAMGIPVFVRKDAVEESGPATAHGLRLGPGSGQFMLLCGTAEESAGQLAADIGRAFAQQPVWAWPADDETGQSAETAVDEHLFTHLVVFGAAPARQAFGDTIPDTIGPARVLLVPAMTELSNDASARQELWRAMCAKRLAAGR